jgi:hypothetical protein
MACVEKGCPLKQMHGLMVSMEGACANSTYMFLKYHGVSLFFSNILRKFQPRLTNVVSGGRFVRYAFIIVGVGGAQEKIYQKLTLKHQTPNPKHSTVNPNRISYGFLIS